MAGEITALLQRLRALNDDEDIEQEIVTRKTIEDEIATLAPGRARPLSPMLRKRYEFAYEWVGANLSQTWLGLDKIAGALDDPAIRKCIELRAENWRRDPPAATAPENTAIYGVDLEEYEETYLVWVEGEDEPQIHQFYEAQVNKFFNLQRYLEYLLGDRDEDDSDPSMYSREG